MSQSAAIQVLEVIKVEPSGENKWMVVGLTYETIAVGEKLYICQEQETLNPHLAFEISRIEVFKREISERDRGFGVRLDLIGEAGEKLQEVKHLYKMSTE
jgi:hypothetical protein